MQYLLPTVAALSPLIAFIMAGALELRSNRSLAEKLFSLAPVALGILVFGLFWAPEFLPHIAKFGIRWLTFFSAAVASSGAVVPFSRRSSAVLVALGGLMLAFIGIFFPEAIP